MALASTIQINHPPKEYSEKYLKEWLRYADTSEKYENLYDILKNNDIGTSRSIFYEAFSLIYEKHGDLDMARTIYEQGIKNNAQPIDRLQKNFTNFLERASFKRRKVESQEQTKSNYEANALQDSKGEELSFEEVRAQWMSLTQTLKDETMVITKNYSEIVSMIKMCKNLNDENMVPQNENIQPMPVPTYSNNNNLKNVNDNFGNVNNNNSFRKSLYSRPPLNEMIEQPFNVTNTPQDTAEHNPIRRLDLEFTGEHQTRDLARATINSIHSFLLDGHAKTPLCTPFSTMHSKNLIQPYSTEQKTAAKRRAEMLLDLDTRISTISKQKDEQEIDYFEDKNDDNASFEVFQDQEFRTIDSNKLNINSKDLQSITANNTTGLTTSSRTGLTTILETSHEGVCEEGRSALSLRYN